MPPEYVRTGRRAASASANRSSSSSTRARNGGAAQPVQAALQHQVVAAGGDGSAPERCGDDADDAAHPLRVAQHVVPGDRRGARVGAGERGQDLDGGGLAGPVRAEQAEHLAGATVSDEAVEGAHVGSDRS